VVSKGLPSPRSLRRVALAAEILHLDRETLTGAFVAVVGATKRGWIGGELKFGQQFTIR